MADKIDHSKGYAAFIIADGGAPAWHGMNNAKEGVDYQNIENVLDGAGLNFHVEKLPNTHRIPVIGQPGVFISIKSDASFFTYRTDTNGILGDKVGKDYVPLQTKIALNIVDEILQSGETKIETAGALDGGRVVFVCLKIDKPIRVGNDDVVFQYLLVCTTFDGKQSTIIMGTNVRVVCWNTLTAALEGAISKIKIRHTINQEDRLREAAKAMNMIHVNTEANTENYNRMKELIISKEEMFDYFGNIFCTPQEIAQFQSGAKSKDVISTQKKNLLECVGNFAINGVGQELTLNNGNLTMWTAYNAVTGCLTRKTFKSAEQRADALLFGKGAEYIETAGNLALMPNKIQTLHKIDLKGINLN